jgi:hypothetical protein
LYKSPLNSKILFFNKRFIRSVSSDLGTSGCLWSCAFFRLSVPSVCGMLVYKPTTSPSRGGLGG